MSINKNSEALGIVIVTYFAGSEVKKLLDQLEEQKRSSDFVVVFDNHPSGSSAKLASNHPVADLVLTGHNVGFGPGCDQAVEQMPASTELILLINPDVTLTPTVLDEIRVGQADWAAWQGLLVLPSGRVNSAGNVVHMSGLSWCDDYGRPATKVTEKEVVVLSGACMVVRREIWRELGGFGGDYFLYYEDTDLSLRLHLQGYKCGLLPKAHFVHDYDYAKGSHKWYYIERNRYVFMIRTWPGAVLALLATFLLVSELGLWVIALVQGRFMTRIRAVVAAIGSLPTLLRQRRNIQRQRKISSRQFLALLQATVNTPLLGVMRNPLTNFLMSAYYRLASLILRLAS